MNPKTSPLDFFATLVSPGSIDDGEIPLTEAALSIAQDVYPQINLADLQLVLDQWAARLAARIPADAPMLHKLRGLNHYFFSELGFTGHQDDYYDPDNSYLNSVIARRCGIPIALAIVYMEIGQQIGLPLRGVSFPGHFLVKLKVRDGAIYIDPYTGRSLAHEQLQELLERVLRAREINMPEIAAPLEIALAAALQEASPREILTRMLRNLKGIYQEHQDLEKLLDVQKRLVILLPDIPEERRDRGLIYAELECPRAALDDLEFYLVQQPQAPERSDIKLMIERLRKMVKRLN